MNQYLFKIEPALPVMTLAELPLLKETLNGLIHTIIFNRAFGRVEPVDEHIESLDLYYARCKNTPHEDFSKNISNGIDSILDLFISKEMPEGRTEFTIVIGFSTQRKKNLFGMGKTHHNFFEQWYITINLSKSRSFPLSGFINDGALKFEKLTEIIKLAIQNIVETTAMNQNHLPPLNISGNAIEKSLQYHFGIQLAGHSDTGMFGMIVNMLKNPNVLST